LATIMRLLATNLKHTLNRSIKMALLYKSSVLIFCF
jgi:hypothetical protein